MEFEVLDVVRVEKEKAVARFNLFRRVAKLWQFFQVLALLGLFSWSSGAAAAAGNFVSFSKFLLNHHVVFFIGNGIVFLLFVHFRRSDSGGGEDDGVYDDYVKHSEVAAAAVPQSEPALSPPEAEEKIIFCTAEVPAEIRHCDDVAAVIEKAARQIKRFERTQSEKLRREIAVRPQQAELPRSETRSRRREEVSGVASEIETLSSEEFRQTVEAFIDKHWSKKEIRRRN